MTVVLVIILGWIFVELIKYWFRNEMAKKELSDFEKEIFKKYK